MLAEKATRRGFLKQVLVMASGLTFMHRVFKNPKVKAATVARKDTAFCWDKFGELTPFKPDSNRFDLVQKMREAVKHHDWQPPIAKAFELQCNHLRGAVNTMDG